MTLETLTDDELRAAIEQAEKLLQERDQVRKQKAMEQAKAILAQAGLSLSEVAKLKPKNAKSLHAGMRFFNPEKPEQVYEVGKGRPPGWFEKLRASGTLPIIEAANDNAKRSIAKRGVSGAGVPNA